MPKGVRDLAANPESRALEHAEWLGLPVDRELTLRQQKRFEARARTAKPRQAATLEDAGFHKPRGLDRTLLPQLGSGDRVREHRHCLITGASSPAHWATRRAGKICPSSARPVRACSARWRWRAAIAATPG